LLGPVKIKFIGLFILFFDLLGATSNVNAGGHIGHLGGTMFGFLFVFLLRKGIDLSVFPQRRASKSKPVKRHLKVEYNAVKESGSFKKNASPHSEDVVDKILEKIKRQGLENLTEEEKEILEKASKKN